MRPCPKNTRREKKKGNRKLRLAFAVFLLVLPLPSPVTNLEADAFDDLFFVPLEHLVNLPLQERAPCLPLSKQREQTLLGQVLTFFQPFFCENTEGSP